MFFRKNVIEKKYLARGFKFPKEFIYFIENNKFDELTPLWENLFSDVFSFMSYYDFLLDKYPNGKYIPFALAVDRSGLFNDGYIILSSFDLKNNCIFTYDVNLEYSSLRMNGDFSYNVNDFNSWVKLAKEYLEEYNILHREDDLDE